jgi:dCMP deaminase
VDETPDFSAFIPRIKQVQWDHYYMQVSLTVAMRANCTGQHVAAVLVFNNRIISTGFNGTPSGFPNCTDGGCERCRQRHLPLEQREPVFRREGKHLDLCICVHAEANAFLSAAREGIRTAGATLYVTHKPCFTCLKEAVQAGVERIVYLYEYDHGESANLRKQYEMLAEHLRANDGRNFEPLAAQAELPGGAEAHQREPNLDHEILQARQPLTHQPNAEPVPKRRQRTAAQSSGTPSKSAQK